MYNTFFKITAVIALLLAFIVPSVAPAYAGHLSYTLKQLATHVAKVQQRDIKISTKPRYVPHEPHLRRNHGTIKVQVQVLLALNREPKKAILSTLGFTVTSALPELGMLEGWLPVTKLEALSALAGVQIVRLPDYGIAQGAVTPEGDMLIESNKLRAAGLSGKGVKIGVVSNGIQGIQKVKDAGLLPSDIAVINNQEGNMNEGVLILEIIHRIAPAARLTFCAALTEADVLQCVQSLQEAGADIVDIDYAFSENPFSPRYLAREEALAKKPTLLWVSSVGNSRENKVNAPFNPVNFMFGKGKTVTAMDFGQTIGEASKPYDTIHVDAGAILTIGLAWDDNPNLKHPANIYHIYLLNQDNHLLAQDHSTGENIYAPNVHLNWKNDTGAAQSLRIVVAHAGGSGANRIAMDTYTFGKQPYQTPLSISTPADISGPDLTQDVLSVGAVNVDTPGQIMAYSSQGPTHIEYTYDSSTGGYGKLNEPITRTKPNLVAPTNVSVMGTDGGWGTFGGTSAAAPHVAAAAALLESYGLSKKQTVTAIEKGAIDLGDAGQDNVYGYGCIDVFKALETIDIPPDISITAPNKDMTIDAGKSVIFKGDCASNKHKISAYAWDFANGQTSSQKDLGAITFKKPGIDQVTFNCTDSTGIKNPDQATRTVTVQGQSSSPKPKSNSKHSGGGGSSGPLDLLGLFFLGLPTLIRGSIKTRLV